MNFCDSMMITEEGMVKALGVGVVEIFKNLINAIHKLLNHLIKLKTVIVPDKKFQNLYMKYNREANSFIKKAMTYANGRIDENAVRELEPLYDKLEASPIYKEILEYDTIATDPSKISSNFIVSELNSNLKWMQYFGSNANIKYANDDRGGVGGVGAKNAKYFRMLQKVFTMNYKVYMKFLSFKLPDGKSKRNVTDSVRVVVDKSYD